jgi:hypothetical protein
MTTDLDQPAAGPDPFAAELLRLRWEADLAFNAALAQFQAAVKPTPDLSMASVVRAAQPAFELGFCYLVRQDSDGIEVRLRHRAGAEEISTADAATTCSPSLLLAGLLGIPVESPAQAGDLEQHAGETDQVQPEPYAENASAPTVPEPAAEPAALQEPEPDLMGPDSPADRPGDHPSLASLNQEQIDAAIAMVKQMPAAQRKSFTIAFRNAFDIDSTELRITGHIKQLRHLEFIDRFTVEAGGGIAP